MNKGKAIKKTVIQDSDDDSDSEVPIIAQKATKKKQVEAKKIAKQVPKSESEEEDTPIAHKEPQKQVKTQTGAVKKAAPHAKKAAKQQSSEESESEEEKPQKKVVKAKSPVQKAVVQKKKAEESSEQECEEEVKPKKGKSKSPLQKPVVQKKKAAKQSSEEEESEEVKPKKAVKAKSPVQKPVAHKKKPQAEESSEEEASEEVKPAKVTKAKSPPLKALPKKKPIQQESSEQSESEEKNKKTVTKVKSPIQKAKSPVQKAQPVKKAAKEESEGEESEEKPAQKAPKEVTQKVEKEEEKPEEKVEEMVDEEEEGKTYEVIVKGLSFQAYENDVQQLFQPFGNVLNVKLLTRDDGKSKGIAFVKFGNKSSFNKALQLNGTEQFGRSIVVEEAQGKSNDGGFKKGNFGNNQGNKGGFNKNRPQPQGNADIQTATLFIGGLSFNSTQESISDHFGTVGNVIRARVVTDKETGKPRGFGYVEFSDVETAKKAYQALNGSNLDGRQIRLDSASERPNRTEGGQGGFGGNRGGFGGNRGPRNQGNSTVDLSLDDKNAKKGAIGSFQGKKIAL